MIEQTVLTIYVDGSSKKSPRRGGVGVRYKYTDMNGADIAENLAWPGYMGANSQEMEINACIIGLREAETYLSRQDFKKIQIMSDSKYVVQNYRNAMFLWPNRKWLKSGGAPVLNAKLWIELVNCIKRSGKFVEIIKVKGHSKDPDNKAVDALARASADNALNKPISVRIVRRKKTKELTRVGSVKMLGQRITIRITEGQRLSPQHIYRYRYEVMSKASAFYKKADFICTDEVLHETSIYYVKLNTDSENPRIEKVYHEVLSHKETEKSENVSI